ncbi:MAG: outer membrane protein assembly factor BamD [Candidatus Firestonebacteria bacterium]|nr:outer membrane protein assembly factor BamD [Candidatus Firestonebacteria bacterium]
MYILLTSGILLFFFYGCAGNKDNARIDYRELDKKALEIMEVAKAHYEKKNYFRARWNYGKVIKKYPKSNYADDAQFNIARIFHEQESYWRAIDEYKKLVDDFPASDKIPDTAKYLNEIGEEYWQKNKKYDAVETFKKAIEIYPFGKFAPDIQFRIANYYFEEKEYEDAIIHFEKIIRLYPDHPMFSMSEYKLGICYFNASSQWALDQETTQKAIHQMEIFIERYPNSIYINELKSNINICKDRLSKRLYKTGEFYFDNDKHEAAVIYYKNVIEEYPETKWAAYAQFGIAETFEKESDWNKAIQAYRKLLEDYPDSELTEKVLTHIERVNSKIVK